MPELTFASIVSQDTTWSCLNVSLESFHYIVHAHNFSDNIYDVVQAFRHRRNDIQQFRWSACRARSEGLGADHYGQSLAVRMIRRSNAHVSGRDLL